MEFRWLRPLKGFLIFLTFLGIGFALLVQPNRLIVDQIRLLHIPVVYVAVAFFVSALMSFLTGLLRWNWNAIWISVFIFYSIIAWATTFNTGTITGAPFAYTLLSAFLTMDVISDLLRGRNGRVDEKR